MPPLDADGCNWSASSSLAGHPITISKIFLKSLMVMDQYKTIDVGVMLMHEDHVSGRLIIFLPAMSHLNKNIVTCLSHSRDVSRMVNVL